jgi:aldose 1-epimerase
MSQYRAAQEREGQYPVVRLSETESGTELSVSPAFGAIGYDMHVGGKKVLWGPAASLSELIARPRLCGNPILAPWANRIDGMSYQANGKKYLLNGELGNLRLDANKNPIHGLVTFSDRWRTLEASSNGEAAWARLALEFGKYPDWLAHFPFAHRIEITYRLTAGQVEVKTEVTNQSAEPMPLAIGYHPYFQVSDAPRDEWRVTIPAKQQYVLSPKLIPTGEMKASPYPGEISLKGVVLDDVFGGLERDAKGMAVFRVQGKEQTVEVVYGPEYKVGVVYAPAGQNFICFEPMTAPTNAFNMAGAARSVEPGGVWRESYWIRTRGF